MNKECVIQLISKLEDAGNILENQGLPNLNEVVHQTEILIDEFYNLPLQPFECLELLGVSGHSFVHFHVCKLLARCISSHWQACDKVLLYIRLLCNIRALSSKPFHVRQSYLSVVANVYKRIKLDCIETPPIYTSLEGLLADEEASLNDLALSLMALIVDEFSRWQVAEEWLKEAFEGDELVRFFSWYKQILVKEVAFPASVPPLMLEKVLECMKSILSWDFSKVPSSLSSFKSTPAWLEILFGEDHFSLFLQLCTSLRQRPEQQESLVASLECVSQLATTELPLELSTQLSQSLEHFFNQYLQLPTLSDEEIFALSCIITNLITFSQPLRVLSSLHHPHKLISNICHLVISISKEAFDSDSSLKDAYSNFIEIFHHLTSTALYCRHPAHISSFVKDNYPQFSTQIWSSFLGGRLFLNEAMDKIAFNDMLYYVGIIGRGALSENFCLAIDLLITESQAFSEGLLSGTEGVSSSRLQWLMSVVGGLLVDCMDSSMYELPKQLMEASMQWKNDESNPFVRLMRWVEEFVRLEERVVAVRRSRDVAGVMDCFIELLDRLNSAYLLFEEDKFDCISMAIFEVFAVDTESASRVAEVLMRAIFLHMGAWTGERNSVGMFEEFLKHKEKKKLAVISPLFQACLQRHQQLLCCIQQQDGE